MATWQLVEFAGLTIASLIESHIKAADPKFAGVIVRVATAASFKELSKVTKPVVSLFLYRVTDVAEMRNGRERRSASGELSRQPLPLELCYLLTPWAKRGADAASDFTATAEEAEMIGLAMQALYDHAEVSRAELLEPTAAGVWSPEDGLQVMLESLPIEDQYRIWDATDLAYRLSLAYRVRVLALESTLRTRPSRVVEATFVAGEV